MSRLYLLLIVVVAVFIADALTKFATAIKTKKKNIQL